MAAEVEDRRVGRTRKLLKGALLDLISKRDYDSITIQDITEQANVGRSTFYSHYTSKADLLFSGFDTWLLSLADRGMETADSKAGSFRFCRPLLGHVRSARRFFLATVGHGAGASVHRKIHDLLADVIRRELSRTWTSQTPEHSREARVRCLVGAFVGLVTWWLQDPSKMTVEEVDRVFQGMASVGQG